MSLLTSLALSKTQSASFTRAADSIPDDNNLYLHLSHWFNFSV